MKIYGHPWSTNTRKTLATLAEKGGEAELVLVMIPKGEQRHPDHLARHPFGKVPVLEDDGFVLYETRAINRYLDEKLGGARLTPADPKASALVDQWTNAADSYFIPHAASVIVETMFRRYLGGDQDLAAIDRGREAMQPALDALDRRLASNDYVAGSAFTLADIHFMPYFEYLVKIGEAEHVTRRKHLDAWWRRVESRPAWRSVARTGPQPYESGMTAAAVETMHRGAA
jgi:glutathione S-transferase